LFKSRKACFAIALVAFVADETQDMPETMPEAKIKADREEWWNEHKEGDESKVFDQPHRSLHTLVAKEGNLAKKQQE